MRGNGCEQLSSIRVLCVGTVGPVSGLVRGCFRIHPRPFQSIFFVCQQSAPVNARQMVCCSPMWFAGCRANIEVERYLGTVLCSSPVDGDIMDITGLDVSSVPDSMPRIAISSVPDNGDNVPVQGSESARKQATYVVVFDQNNRNTFGR